MSTAYDPELRELAQRVAKKLGIFLHEGIYVGQSGPTYSTQAEYKLFRLLGGDAIGMSTVPEVLVANYLGLKVLGISCVTDMATGEVSEPLTHGQVIEVANRVKPQFMNLIKGVIQEIGIYQNS
jgi:purine-nucleoside phosphorylase